MVDERSDRTATHDTHGLPVLEGAEAVRKRPRMFIGSTDYHGMHHMVYEVVDNSARDAMTGCASHIHVTLLADGGVRVFDDGCGIPVHPGPEDRPAVEVLMTTLYYRGRPDWATAHGQAPGGPCRIGLTVVNALSERLEVEVRRQGHVWHQSYRRGIPEAPLAKGETTTTTGTTITFWADPEIFTTTVYDAAILRARCRQLACLTEGLRLTFTDERGLHADSETFSGGLADYVAHLNQHGGGHSDHSLWRTLCDADQDGRPAKTREPIHDQIITLETADTARHMRAQIAMQWTGADDASVHTFVNTILTSQGGTHAEGFRETVTALIAQHAKDAGLREVEPDLADDEVCQGLTAVVSVTMDDPWFEGPTKAYLGNPEVKDLVVKTVVDGLGGWLVSHPDAADTIARHAVQVATTPVTTATQEAVLAALLPRLSLDEVVRRSGLTSSQARRTLTSLVAAGRVSTKVYDHLGTEYFVPRT